MRRNCNKVLPEWRVPENENETVNKKKCWKYNKNVSKWEKMQFRASNYEKKVEMIG